MTEAPSLTEYAQSDVCAAVCDFLRREESLVLQAYDDLEKVKKKGTLTIGYGHTGNVKPGDKITREQAEQLLIRDSWRAYVVVCDRVLVPISIHQATALTSLVFNIGGDRFARSTLLRRLNAGDYAGAADQFSVWKYSKGVVLAGLVSRRARERALFLRDPQ